MSPPVSPRRRRYRGSGSSEPKGLTHSRKAAFLRTCQSCNVDSCRTPPPAAPPLSALCARQRRTLLHRINCTQTSLRVCQLRSLFSFSTLPCRVNNKSQKTHDLSTLCPQPPHPDLREKATQKTNEASNMWNIRRFVLALYARGESNPNRRNRNPKFYPLNYGRIFSKCGGKSSK